MLTNSSSDSQLRSNSTANEHIKAAANWHVIMHSGEVTNDERAEFEQWHQQEKNADAYDKFVAIWARFEPAEETLARAAVSKTLNSSKRTYAISATAKAVVSCFVIVGVSTYLLTSTLIGKVIIADHYAVTDQLKIIKLSDNSKIQLSPLSAVNISYTDKHRHIELLTGQIMIDVGKDIHRPLIISSQHGSARALGTQFSVTDFGDYSQVSVYESNVEVCSLTDGSSDSSQKESKLREDNQHKCQQLSAGQSSTLTTNAVEKPHAANKGWHINLIQQTLVVDDQPLLNVLAELKSQHFGYIKINKSSLENLRVSGVFPLNDVDHALTVLAASLPIKVSRYSPLFISIDKKAKD